MEDQTTDQSTVAESSMSASWGWLWAVILILLVLLLAPLGFWMLLTTEESSGSKKHVSDKMSVDELPPVEGEPFDASRALSTESLSPESSQVIPALPDDGGESLRLQMEQVKLVRWKRVKQQVLDAEQRLSDARKEVTAWSDAVKSLRASEDGRRLAADLDLLAQYEILVSYSDKSEPSIDSQDEQLDALRSAVDVAITLGARASDPTVEFQQELCHIDQEATRQFKRYLAKNQ